MTRTCKFILALMLLLVSTGLAAQSVAKFYGPYMYLDVQQFNFNDPWILSGTLEVYGEGTRQNPQVHLYYRCSYYDWYDNISLDLLFNGHIPADSLTWTGQPKFGGKMQITLNVDTSNIEPSSEVTKEGPGGPIQITWTQDALSEVGTYVGPITYESNSDIYKLTGRYVQLPTSATGFFLALPVDESTIWFNLTRFYDQTLQSHIKK